MTVNRFVMWYVKPCDLSVSTRLQRSASGSVDVCFTAGFRQVFLFFQ